MTGGLEIAKGASTNVSVSYMQSVTPALQLGGQGKYKLEKGALSTALAGVYDDEKQLVAGLWDQNVSNEINLAKVCQST